MNDRQVLAVVTARGGSKGIPRKNLKSIMGKPLIAYSIEAALNARCISRTVVSTDDESIAAVARAYGAEVPFMRPDCLATDSATSVSVLSHAVAWLAREEGYLPDIVVCLQPTSPLRSAGDIDQAVELCIRSGADSVVSLCEAKHHPYWMKRVIEGRVYSFMEADELTYRRRQDLPPVYQLNGALYVTRRRILLEEEKMLGGYTAAYIMPEERSIDIDTPCDFMLAELMMEKGVS